MPVDDLWYSSKRDKGPDGKLLPPKKTQRHGRGKRWRVRYTDPDGQAKQRLFERKPDAERFDANVRADVSRGQYVDPAGGRTTVAQYAEIWRAQQLHRDSTSERTERVLRLHVLPMLGRLQLTQVRASHLKSWVLDRAAVLAPSTLSVVYNGTVVPLFSAAVADRLIGLSPCVGVRLPEVEDSAYHIATAEQVHALADALPERYRAIPYVSAGLGWRAGEVFGVELDAVDFLRREAHVRQQLKVLARRRPFLALPKTKTSKRTNELPESVSLPLARHLEQFKPVEVEVDDETDPRRPRRRKAKLLFTNEAREPIHAASWSHTWSAAVRKVGLPAGFGLRDLRHYFATVLIFGGSNVKTVQLAMGHTTPTITLNTYVGYWPDALDRTRNLVDSALAQGPNAPGLVVAK